MKDGAIVQAVIWSNCKALARRHHVIQCILSHVLQNQLAGIADPEPQIEVADGQPLDKVIFRKHHSEASWKLAYDAFERLAKKIRNSRGDGGEGCHWRLCGWCLPALACDVALLYHQITRADTRMFAVARRSGDKHRCASDGGHH